MGILAISEDPEEMSQNAAFNLGLHCLVIQKQSSRKEKEYNMEIITPQYAQSDCIASNFMENSIGQKWDIIFLK